MQHMWSLGEIADAIGVAVDSHVYEGKLNLKGVPTTDPMGNLFNYTIVNAYFINRPRGSWGGVLTNTPNRKMPNELAIH